MCSLLRLRFLAVTEEPAEVEEPVVAERAIVVVDVDDSTEVNPPLAKASSVM